MSSWERHLLKARELLREARARLSSRDDGVADTAPTPESTDALFALGTLAAGPLHRAAEARDLFAAYLARSPAGPLAPEAALGAIDAAVTLHDPADARTRIAAFIARHPTHPAAPRLRRLGATLP